MSDSIELAARVSVSREYPAPLLPPIAFGAPNEPIQLYSGAIDFTQGRTAFQAQANVCLEWLPSPRIRFSIPKVPVDTYPDLGDVSLRLDDGTFIERAFISNVNQSSGPEGYKAQFSGLIDQRVIHPKGDLASFARFLLPNFDAPVGQAVAQSPSGSRAARLSLVAEGWKITLDDVSQAKDIKATLQSSSGFAITQIGRLERADGALFSAEEAIAVLDALGWYVSFACGRWTGPCLPCGYDATDKQIWQIWDIRRIVSYKERSSWMDHCHRGHFELPFPKFLQLWQDDEWEQVIRLAIHWYIEANASAGSIEGAIVLTQTAFEMLASFLLVEQEGWMASESCDKLPAADRIRLLLRWAGVPAAIPSELTALVKLAKANEKFMLNKQPDTAAAMSIIRNTITHPTRKNRDKIGKHPSEARTDAWKLGLWVLELCLLRLFEYHGTYGCRLKQHYQGEVEQVPWRSVVKQ